MRNQSTAASSARRSDSNRKANGREVQEPKTLSPAEIETLRSSLDLKSNGKQYDGACPVCGEGEDRFRVDKTTGVYGCRQCGISPAGKKELGRKIYSLCRRNSAGRAPVPKRRKNVVIESKNAEEKKNGRKIGAKKYWAANAFDRDSRTRWLDSWATLKMPNRPPLFAAPLEIEPQGLRWTIIKRGDEEYRAIAAPFSPPALVFDETTVEGVQFIYIADDGRPIQVPYRKGTLSKQSYGCMSGCYMRRLLEPSDKLDIGWCEGVADAIAVEQFGKDSNDISLVIATGACRFPDAVADFLKAVPYRKLRLFRDDDDSGKAAAAIKNWSTKPDGSLTKLDKSIESVWFSGCDPADGYRGAATPWNVEKVAIREPDNGLSVHYLTEVRHQVAMAKAGLKLSQCSLRRCTIIHTDKTEEEMVKPFVGHVTDEALTVIDKLAKVFRKFQQPEPLETAFIHALNKWTEQVTKIYREDPKTGIEEPVFQRISVADTLAWICVEASGDLIQPGAELATYEWDGARRLDNWMQNVWPNMAIGPLTEWVNRFFFVALLWRACKKPGCKLDEYPLIYGKRGIGKSALCTSILPASLREEWFAADLSFDMPPKQRSEFCRSNLVLEIQESVGLNRKLYNTIKAFLSLGWDKIRIPYERDQQDIKRQCIFVLTSERADILPPDTNRRIIPQGLGDVSDCAIEDYLDSECENSSTLREQLFAEAWWRIENEGMQPGIPQMIGGKPKVEVIAEITRQHVQTDERIDTAIKNTVVKWRHYFDRSFGPASNYHWKTVGFSITDIIEEYGQGRMQQDPGGDVQSKILAALNFWEWTRKNDRLDYQIAEPAAPNLGSPDSEDRAVEKIVTTRQKRRRWIPSKRWLEDVDGIDGLDAD